MACVKSHRLERWFLKDQCDFAMLFSFKSFNSVCFQAHRLNTDLIIEQHSKTTLFLKNQFSSIFLENFIWNFQSLPDRGAPAVGLVGSPTNILPDYYSNSDVIEIMTSPSLHQAHPIFLCRRPPCFQNDSRIQVKRTKEFELHQGSGKSICWQCSVNKAKYNSDAQRTVNNNVISDI